MSVRLTVAASKRIKICVFQCILYWRYRCVDKLLILSSFDLMVFYCDLIQLRGAKNISMQRYLSK